MKKYLFLGLALGLSATSIAQMNLSLDSIVVKENRITTPLLKHNENIEVITQKQIATYPVKSATELLSYINGVDLRQRGPAGVQADISIDGSTFDEVLILINGVKLSDPQTGHHLLNIPIPLQAIDHIEILRGAASNIYGVNALAGAINIITRQPEKNELSAQAYTASSFINDTSTGETYYSYGVQAAASLNAKNQSHLLSFAHDQGNGYRYNTAFRNSKFFYNNHIALAPHHSIDAMGGYTNNDFGASLYYAAPNDGEATEKVETALGSIKYSWQCNDRLSISPRVSYRYNKDDYIYLRQKPEVYHNIHETGVVTGEVQGSYKVGNGIIGAGVEYRSEQINSSNLGKRSRENTGVYAEYKYHYKQKFNAAISFYGNYSSNYGWLSFPAVNAGYFITRHLKISATASSGARLPTYTDLYYKGPSNIGNDLLKPEYASYVSGGLQYNNSKLLLKAMGFYRHTDNFIDWVKDSIAGKWQPQNFQTVATQGLTISGSYDLTGIFSSAKTLALSANLSYTYLDATINTPSEKLSKYAIDALRHQFIAGVHATLYERLQLNFNGRYQYRISANDYTLIDARVVWLFKNWNIYADVSNLLNTDYKEIGAVPLPGRWYSMGLRFQLK